MISLTLDPAELTVDSFEVGSPVLSSDRIPPTTMKTFEPGCTTPELCPITP